MKHGYILRGLLTLAFAGVSLLAGQAGPIQILGGLSSFQGINSDPCAATGFEIGLAGFKPGEVRQVGGQSVFGAATVLDAGVPGAPAAVVRYGSESGPGLVAAGDFTQFGVSLPNHPAVGGRTLRWLHDPNVCGPGAPLRLPGHRALLVTNSASPSGLSLRDRITHEADPNEPLGGSAVWVLPYVNQIRGRANLELLASTNDIVRNARPVGGGTNGLVPFRLGPGDYLTYDSFISSAADNSGIFKYRVFADAVDSKGNRIAGEEIASFVDATVTGDSAAPASSRKLLLVVEDAVYPLLTAPLAQYVADVGVEGWSVSVVTVPSNTTNSQLAVTTARQTVWPRIVSDGISHVFLVGNVPMPRSGLTLNPDGHLANRGAYSCPGYYGCPSSLWSDLYKGDFSSATFSNLPGDGRLDQNTFPEFPKASVGVLNFKSDSAPKDWNTTRVQLMVNYFNRLHAYRSGKWTVQERALYPMGITGPQATWAYHHWTVVNQFKAFFGTNAVWNATTEMMATTKVTPAVKMLWLKSDQYGAAVKKATVPKVVMFMPLNSNQISYSTYLHGNDLYNAMSATNGPLITAVNHFNYPWRLERLKSGGCVGDAYLDTTAVNGYPAATWNTFMGDPALRLW